MLSEYRRIQRNKTLPVLKTEKDLEAEGIARLSIDLPSIQLTDEPESVKVAPSQTESSKTPLTRSKLTEVGLLAARHSIGFDVPGAVHTIVTPRMSLLFFHFAFIHGAFFLMYLGLRTERQIDSKLVVIMGKRQ